MMKLFKIIISDYLFDKNRKIASLNFSVSYEKDTTKHSEVKQLIKPWPYRTEPNRTEPGEIRYLKLGTLPGVSQNQ